MMKLKDYDEPLLFIYLFFSDRLRAEKRQQHNG